MTRTSSRSRPKTYRQEWVGHFEHHSGLIGGARPKLLEAAILGIQLGFRRHVGRLPLNARARLPMNLLAKALCAFSIAVAAPAWADIGRDEAAAVAQRVASGRVLSVDRADADGRSAWRVKVLTGKGEVRVILIDAASGRVIG